MRPARLELSGFTAFRDPVEMSFDGAELFALAGPTGAGKSSVIDAMCFALFGSVPRLDRRTVAPVISTGRTEARVRFDFTIGDRTFTAVRVVRRQPRGGASTKEARLEADGEILAGDADAMTVAVERLIGLGFDQFTKCVVLPQGDFARFLHDKPSDRQDLLVRLLELDVYARMRSAANSRRVAAESAAEVVERRLAEMSDATPQARDAAIERVRRLSQLRAEIDTEQPRLDELIARRDAARSEAAAAEGEAARLREVAVPDGVEALSDVLTEAEQRAARAAAAAEQAESAVTEAERHRATLGDQAVLAAAAAVHERRRTLAARVAKGRPAVREAEERERVAAGRAAAAAAEAAAAEEALQAARREHAAHAVAATLVAGEPCPVCLQPVTSVPDRRAPAALAGAEQAAQAAAQAAAAADQAVSPLRDARVGARRLLDQLLEDLEAADASLASAPPAEEVTRRLDEIVAADAALAAARQREMAARVEARRAADVADRARRRRDEAWTAFDEARDALAALGAPPVDRRDLATSWKELASWAGGAASARADAAANAGREERAADDAYTAATAAMAGRCQECGVVVGKGGRVRDAVADALANAQAEQRRVTEAIAAAERFREELEGLRDRAVVAKTLATHLSARGFEQWLLDEALVRLADGASEVLRGLSSGQYSLALDGQRNFVVVDHRSADDRRPARTLSGGETFLASLSLALTLAEHLTTLAVGAEPRLESIFLDEGFGTLDPDALDVVAGAIEELGARGRTVGIVTHVRDLAERMPVRFEVTRGPAGSTVERSDR